jgi:hypothetical protein
MLLQGPLGDRETGTTRFTEILQLGAHIPVLVHRRLLSDCMFWRLGLFYSPTVVTLCYFSVLHRNVTPTSESERLNVTL